MTEDYEELNRRIIEAVRKAQRLMLERKAKLDESVVYADESGVPYVISAEEALKRLDNKEKR